MLGRVGAGDALSELVVVGAPMRVVTNRTGDLLKFVSVPLHVIGFDTPRRERTTPFMAALATCPALWICGEISVQRLLPLLHEGLMVTGVTIRANALSFLGNLGQRTDDVALTDSFHVGETRAVATLTLHVAVHRVLDDFPSRRGSCGVAVGAYSVAAVAEILSVRVQVKRLRGVGVLGLYPSCLLASVAIPAGGLLGRGIVVAEESARRVGRRIERGTFAEHNRLGGTTGEDRRNKDSRDGGEESLTEKGSAHEPLRGLCKGS
jgi:hypothetical protein